MFYYEVHIFQSRHEGYGVGVKSEQELGDEDVIALAISSELITEEEAAMCDYIEPLTKEEYED